MQSLAKAIYNDCVRTKPSKPVMKRIYLLLSSILLLTLITSCDAKKKAQPVELASPDGSIKVVFQLKNGIPFYNVQRQGKFILNDSKLGFTLKDLPSLDKDFKILNAVKSSFDETWTQPWGEVKN